jgi:hypothetical protein
LLLGLRQVDRLTKTDSKFPKKIKLSARRSGFLRADFERYLAERRGGRPEQLCIVYLPNDQFAAALCLPIVVDGKETNIAFPQAAGTLEDAVLGLDELRRKSELLRTDATTKQQQEEFRKQRLKKAG